ncbi:hypothetical protein IYR97_08025 [Pseudomonas fulva]|uniref:Uncharacterized protein n=1 Tax=Pseudomonas fulva TaxID=47880 RepID=A0A7S9LKH8_9PSED|nr:MULTISPECIES: hypothetical protein [Pseudomonas]QPH45551.1 hypothetical protein IYR97_08025 [Pseudomonas fulva]QPH50636.1 hypothetical protein IZU98_08040 [Pseudomonas fulva]
MLIKKDEMFTLTHDRDERNRPMIALQDFDLVEVANRITSGMNKYDTAHEAWLLVERLEDLGLARTLPQTLIRVYSGAGEIEAEVVEESRRITEPGEYRL